MASTEAMRVVAAAIFDSKNRVLLAEKPKGHKNAGLFEFPGGKVQYPESDSEALTREIHEELNLDITVGELLGQTLGGNEGREIHLLLYQASLIGGDASLNHLKLFEHQSVVWTPLENISQWPLCPLDLQISMNLARSSL